MAENHSINLKGTQNILLVDDSKLNRAIVKKTLSGSNIKITEAEDGLIGLELLARGHYDLILLDIVMPNLDGFGFLEKFKDVIKNNFIPVILMTGLDDLNSKIKGLNIGADDFLLKPLNEKELIARVQSLLRLKSAHAQLYEKNELIKKELAYARRLQQYIIPRDFSYIKGVSIFGRYLPIADIGGDLYDCYNLPNNQIGVLIADVTGHGIPAALVMSMSKMIFSIYAAEYSSTSLLLSTINAEMRHMLLDMQYVTAFYLIIDPVEGYIKFTNAGHTRPLFYRAGTDKIFALDTNGLFIGITDKPKYEEKKIRVEKGDRLFLYTDGITELKNPEKVEFGEKRLASFIRANNDKKKDEFCELLLNTLKGYTALDERSDDIAFLSIEF